MNFESFDRLGLMTVPNFLTDDSCTELRQRMLVSESYTSSDHVCHVHCIRLDKETRAPVRRRLFELLPSLEDHFKIKLKGFQKPQYMVYSVGDSYKRHRDGAPDGSEYLRARKLSAVILLNNESEKPAENCFGGGQLAFYGLLPNASWECGLPLNSVAGLLIAFRPEVVHEVMPVDHGMRFSIATWFF
jgi:SM-20-related protein